MRESAHRSDTRPRLAWLKRVSLAAAAGTATVLACEVALAIAGFAVTPRTYVGQYPDREHARFVADPDVGWRMRPSHSFVWTVDRSDDRYQSDARGFRTYEEPAARPPLEAGAPLIVIAGDSFMWGVGVAYAETAGAQIERARPGYRVDNMAMPGFGLDQIWLSLRHWALPLRPAVVVVGVYSEDLGRSLSAYRFVEGFNKPTFKVVDGTLVPATPADRPVLPIRFIEEHSRLLTLWRRVEPMSSYFGVGKWWRLNAAILDVIREDCRRAGTRLVFVHIPHKRSGAIRALTRYMQATGAEFIDLANVAIAERRLLYFEGDGHLNEAGHRRLAQLLLEWLEADHARGAGG
jgi:hypothetical protein